MPAATKKMTMHFQLLLDQLGSGVLNPLELGFTVVFACRTLVDQNLNLHSIVLVETRLF